MPYAITRFDPTPNPNALKCILDRPISDRPRSFRSAAEATSDPLAAAIFAVPGVTNLLLNGDWLTVNKSSESEWKPVKAGVQAALRVAP
ncbi:MAG: NifU N-terminal domain-containing protein [Phycisphaerales bacterium]|nr:NifU N-terminal domain-containing protein [Phycisphaerales bacterium]